MVWKKKMIRCKDCKFYIKSVRRNKTLLRPKECKKFMIMPHQPTKRMHCGGFESRKV